MEDRATTVQKILRSDLVFYATIAVAVFAFAAMWFNLSGKMDVFAERMDTHIRSTADMPASVATLREQMAVVLSVLQLKT